MDIVDVSRNKLKKHSDISGMCQGHSYMYMQVSTVAEAINCSLNHPVIKLNGKALLSFFNLFNHLYKRWFKTL